MTKSKPSSNSTSTLPKPVRIKSNYQPTADDTSASLVFEPSKVQEQFAAESNINNIMKKYKATGIFPSQITAPVFADVSDGFDFAAAQQKILHMNDLFSQLPAAIRKEVGTPQAFYNAFTTSEGIQRMRALKIIPTPTQEDPAPKGGQPAAPAVASSLDPTISDMVNKKK